eukprot:12037376-Prorocentrum_lima.AAC.1
MLPKRLTLKRNGYRRVLIRNATSADTSRRRHAERALRHSGALDLAGHNKIVQGVLMVASLAEPCAILCD